MGRSYEAKPVLGAQLLGMAHKLMSAETLPYQEGRVRCYHVSRPLELTPSRVQNRYTTQHVTSAS